MKIIVSIIFLIFFTSCASYIDGLHRQISREEYAQRSGKQQNFDRQDARPIANPVTLNGSGGQESNPQYSNNKTEKKRFKATDMRDNDSSGSLWSEKSDDSFLFISNTQKKEGDFVIVEVLTKLKDEITEELNRNYPPIPELTTSTAKTATATTADAKPDTPEAKSTDGASDPKQVHDKISTQVIEKINKDYVLLRGRKELVFRKAKRYIEFQAIVSTRDIKDNDSVTSDKVLEPRITVLRY